MLKDSDLILRPYQASDREALVKLADNPKVAHNLTNVFPNPYTPEDADAWLKLTADEERPLNFAIIWQGNFVGGAGLIPMTDVHCGTSRFGYWLGEPYWGKGLAARAAALLADYAFKEFKFIRLQAMVFARNPGSMKVLEKCGFQREGVMRCHVTKNGQVLDAVLYARLREDQLIKK